MSNRRLVVTGQTAEGRSVIVSDTEVAPIEVASRPGYQFHRIWGSDFPPSLPNDGSPPDQPRYFPPPGGYRFVLFTVGPASVILPDDFNVTAGLNELEHKLPGINEVMEPNHPGMHTTDSVDLDLVISGEVWLELDDRKEVHLATGDTVILNGTRHSWHNRSEEPCVIFTALLGALRVSR